MPHRHVTLVAQAPPPFHLKSPEVNPHFIVVNVIFACGVTDSALLNDYMKADRIPAELFDDGFYSCMDKNYEEFKKYLKSYSNPTVVNGKISL